MKKKKILIPILAILLIAIVVVIIVLANRGGSRVINVYNHDGDVTYERKSKVSDIVDGMQLISKDIVSTKAASTLELLVDSDKHVVARENTSFEVIADGNEEKGNVTINLLSGQTLITIDNKLSEDSYFGVMTPNATLSVRGTTFDTTYDTAHNETILMVQEGVVNVKTNIAERDVNAGESVVVKDGMIEDVVIIAVDFFRSYDVVVPDYANYPKNRYEITMRGNDYYFCGRYETNSDGDSLEFRNVTDEVHFANPAEEASFIRKVVCDESDINRLGADIQTFCAALSDEELLKEFEKFGPDYYTTESKLENMLLTDADGNRIEIPIHFMGVYYTGSHLVGPEEMKYYTPLINDGSGRYYGGLDLQFNLDPAFAEAFLAAYNMNLELK